jgi:hypothetical protein
LKYFPFKGIDLICSSSEKSVHFTAIR